MTTQAVSYRRVSSAKQGDGHGPERQAELISEYAGANGYHLVDDYLEKHTGTETDRPEFVRMVAELLTNGCRTIIVESLDRFARDLLVQTSLLADLKARGLTLIAANTGTDVTAALDDDPMRKAMIQVQGVFSELDKSLLVRKLRKARDAKRVRTGRCEGQKPYGYHPDEQAVLARVKVLRRKPRGGKRMSWAEVASHLNAEGLFNRSGDEWSRQSLHKVARPRG